MLCAIYDFTDCTSLAMCNGGLPEQEHGMCCKTRHAIHVFTYCMMCLAMHDEGAEWEHASGTCCTMCILQCTKWWQYRCIARRVVQYVASHIAQHVLQHATRGAVQNSRVSCSICEVSPQHHAIHERGWNTQLASHAAYLLTINCTIYTNCSLQSFPATICHDRLSFHAVHTSATQAQEDFTHHVCL